MTNIRKKLFLFSLIVSILFITSGLYSQNAIYWQKIPVIAQPQEGTGFVHFEQRLNSSLNQILNHLNNPAPGFNTQEISDILAQLTQELQNMMNDPQGPDDLTCDYYLGLIYYGLWLLDVHNLQRYQNALAQFNGVVQGNNPAGLGELGVYYYSSMYLKGLLPIQKYWLISGNGEIDIRTGIQNLHAAVTAFNLDKSAVVMHLRHSSEILIAWADIERCYLNPTPGQITINLDDAESMLSGNFDNDPRLTQIKFYFLAIIKYIRSVLADDADFTMLMAEVDQILNSNVFIGNLFPASFTDAIFWGRFISALRKNLDQPGQIQLPPINNATLADIARFYLTLAQNGFQNCNFAQQNIANINFPEIQFFNILARFFSVLNNINSPNTPANLQNIQHDFSAYMNQNANSPLSIYANFFYQEIRFYANVIGANQISQVTIPQNLPAELDSILQDRALLFRLMQLNNINNQNINWQNQNDGFAIILTPGLNQLNFRFNSGELFRPSSPVSTLFSLASRDPRYYAPLINLLGYLWRTCPGGQDNLKEKLSILAGWAIFRSNQANAANANLALQWLGINSNNASVNAERDLIKANISYYGLQNNNQACQILFNIGDNRAQQLIDAWQCPASPATLNNYDFIGFYYKDIEDPSIIVCGYDLSSFSTAAIHYFCYRDILKSIFLNRPYNQSLFSLYPLPFLRIALHKRNDGVKYINSFSLMNYLSSGINVGRKIPITFYFPKSGANFAIPGEFAKSTIATASQKINLSRFTSYKIECDLSGYLGYSDYFVFTQSSDVHLDKLMVPEENWSSPKKYSLPTSIRASGPSYFFDIDVDERNQKLAFLATAQNRYFLGIQSDEITDIKSDQVSLYSVPDGIRPVAIALDSKSNLYIADAQTDSIWTTNIKQLSENYNLASLVPIAQLVKNSQDIFIFNDSLYAANSENGEVVCINLQDYNDSRTIIKTSVRAEILARTPRNLYIGSWSQPDPTPSCRIFQLTDIWGIKPFISQKDYIYIGDILTNSIKIFDPSGEQVNSYQLTEMEFPMAVCKTKSTVFIAGKDMILIYDLK